MQSLDIAGISKSEVSRMAASLDARVAAFRTRRLDAQYPYVWVDARYEYVREDHRVQSMAVVIAYGVRTDGVRREDYMENGTVLGRLPALDEVAQAAVFMASERASALTGTIVNLTCGSIMNAT